MNLDFISNPLGQFLLFIYNNMAFHNYGLAIIIFTLFIRVLLLPLTVKQYSSMAKMQEIQPQIQEIQKRYKNDKEKLNQELLRVYQENKVNPAGGCLPLLIQMPILISLYYVISSPLKYMLKMQPSQIEQYKSQLASALNIVKTEDIARLTEIDIINHFNLINMKFLGLNLGLIPKWNLAEIFSSPMALQYTALLIIPALAAITTYISTKFSTVQSTGGGNNNDMAASMNKSMAVTMPAMIAFFSFNVPAGLGLYWIVNNIIQVLQQMYMNKFVIKKKEVAGK